MLGVYGFDSSSRLWSFKRVWRFWGLRVPGVGFRVVVLPVEGPSLGPADDINMGVSENKGHLILGSL